LSNPVITAMQFPSCFACIPRYRRCSATALLLRKLRCD
jgi:hypothetical protein